MLRRWERRSQGKQLTVLKYLDLAVCAGFTLASGVPRMVFVTTMFVSSTLLAYRTIRLRDGLPVAAYFTVVYFVAEQLAGLTPIDTLTSPPELGVLVLIYFFGMGFMAFDITLDRLSFLELDNLLEKQRQGYRRRLHDDLGNTLCGLHFRIETLAVMERDAVRHAIEYIADGYKRAVQVLGRILGGMEEILDADVDRSLERSKAGLERDTGVKVIIAGEVAGANLSPALPARCWP